MNFGNTVVGSTSASQPYTVSGSNLTANLVVTAPTDFQVSTDNISFGSSVSLTPASGTVATMIIYVRFAPSSAGLMSDNVTNASTGATTKNIGVTGTGIQPGTIQFATTSYTVNEGDGTATLTVTRTGGSDGAVSVNYTTVDGTATSGAGNDYTGQSGTLNWATGDATDRTIVIDLLNDTVFENTESFSVNVNTPSGGATIGANNPATVTINDNDVANTNPTISDITDQTISQDTSTGALAFTVGDAETAVASLTVADSSSNQTLVPDANIVFGGSDANRTVTVTPAAGQTGTATVTVTVNDGQSGTASDSFLLTVNAAASTMQFSSATYFVNEDGSATTTAPDGFILQANITVTRTGATDTAATVDYATVAGGTATAGDDYTTTSGTLNFAAGQTSKSFNITFNDDQTDEPDETVNLALSNVTGTGATLGTPGTATLTIVDNDSTPSVSIADAIFAEGDSVAPVGFTVTLSNPSSQNRHG